MPPIECSRTLLFPGPQPPLSHFGATLLRQVVTTGLRYSLHSLGLPMPERSPVRIVRLRVYLDSAKLLEQMESGESSEEIVAALVDPGGAGKLPESAAGARGALAFHRARLRLPSGRPSPALATSDSASPKELWAAFRSEISRVQTSLNDALLGELVAALARRAERLAGKSVEPCLGRQAQRLRAGERSELASLGVPDPMARSWDHSPGVEKLVRQRLGNQTSSPRHRLRGEFREAYRRALNLTREPYLGLARGARDRGLIESPGDAFFLPFELAEDLTADTRPGWLPGAIASNRLEYQNLLDAGGPPESVHPGESKAIVEDLDSWQLAPVWPLE